MSQKRSLRADAERTRLAILCAAGQGFAERGTTLTLEQIAEVASAGVRTIDRRFPSLQDLSAEALEEKMRRFADRTEQAAEQAECAPWEAFQDYVMFTLEQQASDLGFSDVILSPDAGTELFRAEIGRAFHAAERLVESARSADAIRSGFHHSDLYLLQHANGGLVRGVHATAPVAWKRFGGHLARRAQSVHRGRRAHTHGLR